MICDDIFETKGPLVSAQGIWTTLVSGHKGKAPKSGSVIETTLQQSCNVLDHLTNHDGWSVSNVKVTPHESERQGQ